MYMRRAKPSRAEDIPTESQTAPNKIPNRWIDGSRSKICGTEDVRAEDAEASESLDRAEESRADEPIRQKTIRYSKPMEERNVNRRNRDLKSGRIGRHRKRAEDGHRNDRRVFELRAVLPLVYDGFPKTAEEESRGLESLCVRVRCRVSEFAEIPSIVCVCVRVRYIYTYVRTW